MNSKRYEIRLVRHGRSAHLPPTVRVTVGEFRRWIDEYNQSGLANDSNPPRDLIAVLYGTPVVVCSDYPRSIESAKRLVTDAHLSILPLFREAGRPMTSDWGIKLPLSTWDRISVKLWRIGLIAGDESIHKARKRAHEAATVLARLAEDFDRVLCVGHGTFNALVGEKLLEFGWEGPDRISNEYWQGGAYYKNSL